MAGDVKLRDFSFINGANEVEVLITGEEGRYWKVGGMDTTYRLQDLGSIVQWLKWQGLVHRMAGLGLIRTAFFGVVLACVTAGIISIYAHRYMAHGSIKYLHPYIRGFMRFWIWTTTGTNCRRWAALHVKHHRKTDQRGDPHSPNVESSIWRIGPLGNWRSYRRELGDPMLLEHYPPAHGGVADRWDLRCFDHSLNGLRVGFILTCLAIGPIRGLELSVVHSACYVIYAAFVNALGHAWGYQRFTNSGSRYTGNSFVLALFTAGENLHNNHHGDPLSPYFANAWWERIADWPSTVLLVWTYLGWAELNRPRHPKTAIKRYNLAATCSVERILRLACRWTKGQTRHYAGYRIPLKPGALAYRRQLRQAEEHQLKGGES